MQSLTKAIEDEKFMAQMKYFDEFRIANNLETVWSIYEVNDITSNCPIIIKGKKIKYETVRHDATFFEVNADINDGGQRSTAKYTATIEGNTWLDLWKAAEAVIIKSGTHHRYIEDFTMCEDGTLDLTTGS